MSRAVETSRAKASGVRGKDPAVRRMRSGETASGDMPRRTYPIVLAHGIARFDVVTDIALDVDNNDALDHRHYFKNVRTDLNARGFDAWHVQVDWAGSVTKRAADLKRGVEDVLLRTGAPRVHILAHSMGGLDARHMLFQNRHDGFHLKVASVTTIATPHKGSPVADFLTNPVSFLRDRPLESTATPEAQLDRLRSSEEFRSFARIFGMDARRFGRARQDLESVSLLSGVAGVLDLTSKATGAFNAASFEWERTSGVEFRSYAGAQGREDVFLPLRFPWRLVQEREGENDGLVSVESAKWTDRYFQSTLDADHLNELGWWPDVPDEAERARKESDTRRFYLGVAANLAFP